MSIAKSFSTSPLGCHQVEVVSLCPEVPLSPQQRTAAHVASMSGEGTESPTTSFVNRVITQRDVSIGFSKALVDSTEPRRNAHLFV